MNSEPIPAPWEADFENAPQFWQIEIYHRGTPIAYVRNVHDMEDIGDEDPEQIDYQARITARVMAAAPELLAACENVLRFSEDQNPMTLAQLIDQIQAAIGKARGN